MMNTGLINIFNRYLPFVIYVPDGTGYYEVIYAIEMIIMMVLLFIVCSHDCLLSTICLEISIQFKLLAHRVANMKADDDRAIARSKITMRECAAHHAFILE